MSQKVQLFAWAERKKSLMNPLKKNSTKHWLQQNWFVDVPKLSQMCHWSKAKTTKLEKINIINIIRSIKLIKFMCTCRSQVGKKKPSLDKSYTITRKIILSQLWFEEVLYSSLMQSLIKGKGCQHWRGALSYNVVAFCHAKKQYNLQFTTHTLHH
jgi:hypothetical protein